MNDEFMIQLQNKLSARERQALESNGNVVNLFSRKQIEQNFIETFELIGGVPRLALWAAEEHNYGDFLQMLMKLAPKDTGGNNEAKTIEYRSFVPQSPLNKAPALEQVAECEFVEEVVDERVVS